MADIWNQASASASAPAPAPAGLTDSAWGNGEAKSALADITPANGTPTLGGPPKNEDALKLARDAGWVQPTTYNYGAKAPVTVLRGEDAEAKPDAAPAAEGEGADDAPSTRFGQSTWSHDAAKYEWKEEYGDVGPRDEKLEKELFYGEHLNRKGAKLDV